jgi:hypothetical protein
MRVKTLTLTTASAAALTIGFASPAFALATTAGGLGAAHYQTAHRQGTLHNGVHHQVMLPRDDDDDEGDGGGDGGGEAEIGGSHHSRHTGRGLCGVGGHIGGLSQGCGEESGDDDDDEGGGGEGGSEHTSSCCAHEEHARGHAAPSRVIVHRQVQMVPSGAVRSGFGGSQEPSAALGIAGLSLLLGGAGLVPLARRRRQASARS